LDEGKPLKEAEKKLRMEGVAEPLWAAKFRLRYDGMECEDEETAAKRVPPFQFFNPDS
jgi:hypothetical protein